MTERPWPGSNFEFRSIATKAFQASGFLGAPESVRVLPLLGEDRDKHFHMAGEEMFFKHHSLLWKQATAGCRGY